jgi:hypothetical protein
MPPWNELSNAPKAFVKIVMNPLPSPDCARCQQLAFAGRAPVKVKTFLL